MSAASFGEILTGGVFLGSLCLQTPAPLSRDMHCHSREAKPGAAAGKRGGEIGQEWRSSGIDAVQRLQNRAITGFHGPVRGRQHSAVQQ